MRYDTPVLFRTYHTGAYDPKTGDYSDVNPSDVEEWASVQDTKEETQRLLYGGLRRGSYTLQIQQAYTEPFTCICLYGREFQVDYSRKLRQKQTFIVSEVTHGSKT